MNAVRSLRERRRSFSSATAFPGYASFFVKASVAACAVPELNAEIQVMIVLKRYYDMAWRWCEAGWWCRARKRQMSSRSRTRIAEYRKGHHGSDLRISPAGRSPHQRRGSAVISTLSSIRRRSGSSDSTDSGSRDCRGRQCGPPDDVRRLDYDHSS